MKIIVIILGFIATLFVLSLVAATPFYFLWNWLMPEIFGFKVLTFWQSFGLLMLSNLLFKSNISSK